MKRDARGLEVSNASGRAIEAISHFALELVSQGAESGDVIEAAEAEPECAMLHAYAASMCAFALELKGRRKTAEAVAKRALEIDPNSMWTRHCLAQV